MLTFVVNLLAYLLVFILLSPVLIVVLLAAAAAVAGVGYCLLCLAESFAAVIETAADWIETHFPS